MSYGHECQCPEHDCRHYVPCNSLPSSHEESGPCVCEDCDQRQCGRVVERGDDAPTWCEE